MSTVLAHLRAQWIGVLALLIALGTGSAYAANTVFSADIVDGEVKTADLANNAVRSAKIRNEQVLNQDLGVDAVDTLKVEDESLENLDLAPLSVREPEIASNSVGTSEITQDGVGAVEIADNSIDAGEVEDESLGRTELATNSVSTGELADDAVWSTNVANNSLTTADFAGVDVTGAISLSAGSVGNGRCKTYDISVPGAVPGAGVMISTKAATQAGIMIYGQRVSAFGTVAMVVCNLSGITQATITALPIRTITYG